MALSNGSALHVQPGVVRTLAIGTGTSGVETITHVKALHLERFGGIRPGTKFLGFDVMESPPVVSLSGGMVGDQAGRAVRLEPNVEYIQIGRGCDPARLSHLVRTGPELNADLRRLLGQQPDSRFAKSLHSGTEGERLYGLVAMYWSIGEVRGGTSWPPFAP